ncbi:MAG: long-chain fatty acid--CoA ligase [Deltaproteobacteria bacterium]|nr:long-chain fatty acid--CoA ligase [Deltaproteobacteria bacterium]MBN2671780.1 long-chain fatty acid--CoA ligase [Deltaproteobacteria bacterium]
MTPPSIFHAAQTHDDAPALIVENKVLTFRQLANLCKALVPHLAALPPDRPVAFTATNDLTSILLIYAALASGRPFVPFHPRATATERDALTRQMPMHVLSGLEIDNWLSSDSTASVQSVDTPICPEGRHPACILFTSGSEGAPKGVVLSYRAFEASAVASADHLKWLPTDRWLLNLPLSHVGGLSILTRCLMAGKCVVVHERFLETTTLESIETHGVTMVSLVPAMLERLIAADEENRLSGLRVILLGGAAASPSLRKKWCDRGLNVYETYGMTECCSQAATSVTPVTNAVMETGLMPLSNMKIHILDAQQNTLPPMQTGRIALCGSSLMTAYVGSPPLSGPLVTQDIGYLDNAHCLHIVGRADDVLITGGENVHPAEIERLLCCMDGVIEAVVFGVPHDTYGTQIAAALFVDFELFHTEEMQHHIAQSLAPFKKPRLFCVFSKEEIPLLHNGKIDRSAVITNATPRLSPVLK